MNLLVDIGLIRCKLSYIQTTTNLGTTMKKLISLLVFASIIGYVGNSMATSASVAIAKHNIQIQQIGG